MAGSKTDFWENLLTNFVFRDAAHGLGANLHVSLFTVAPTEASGGTEVTGGSYARVAVSRQTTPGWSTAAGSGTDNIATVQFPTATASWGTVVGYGIHDAATAGNMLYFGDLITGNDFVFTGASADDILRSPAHGMVLDDQVRLRAVQGFSIPTGLVEGTTYFARTILTDSLQLAASAGGAVIDLTSNGAGFMTKYNPKTINNGDTASFAAGALDIIEG